MRHVDGLPSDWQTPSGYLPCDLTDEDPHGGKHAARIVVRLTAGGAGTGNTLTVNGLEAGTVTPPNAFQFCV